MDLMATAKKAVKKVAKAVKKAEKGSPEWLALKDEARKALDAKQR